MKVKLLVSRVGDRFSQIPGQVVNIEDADEAQRMIEAGQCEPVAKEKEKPSKKDAE